MEGQEIQMEDGKGFGLRGSKIGEFKKKKRVESWMYGEFWRRDVLNREKCKEMRVALEMEF